MARFKDGSMVAEASVYGSENAGEDLVLESTSNASKGNVLIRDIVGIKNDTPNVSASLDIGGAGALLIPRLDSFQRDGLSSPADGMMIYNTTERAFNTRQDGIWKSVQAQVVDAESMKAYEQLWAGDVINVFSDAGETKARRAHCNGTNHSVDGFVLSSASPGTNALIYFEGVLQVSGLTTGLRYYLGASGGQISSTSPSGAPYIHQYVGKAISSNKLNFEPSEYVELI